MEDYNSNLLNDSKNEWSIRLMNILSGHIIDGFRAIFREAMEICERNDEAEKYLMTFQNFLSRIPKWNQTMIDTEVNRIQEASQCKYLDDLITCVHIIQLKILSCVRTSNHSQKIDIDIPCFKTFLHVVYINIARKLYSNIYLFQIDASPLEQQKNNREFELIVQTCIMNTIRDNVPVEELLRQYIDETQEVDVVKTEKVISHNAPAPTSDSSSSPPEETSLPPPPPSQTDNNDNGIETPLDTPSENPPPVPPVPQVNDDLNTPPHTTLPSQETPEMAIIPAPVSTTPAADVVTPPSAADNSNELEETKTLSFEEEDKPQAFAGNNKLEIGEDIPLNVDVDDFDMINNDIPLEEINVVVDEPPIDLGIEELVL